MKVAVSVRVTFAADEAVDVETFFDRVAESLAEHSPNAAVSADVDKRLIEAETSVLIAAADDALRAGDEVRSLLVGAFHHAGASGHFAGANYAISEAVIGRSP